MTVKDLADIAGVSTSTIRRTGKELFPEMFTNGLKTLFTNEQSKVIISEVKKKNMVAIQNDNLPMQNAEVPTPKVEGTEMMMQFMIKMQENQNQFMTAVLNKLDGLTGTPQLTAPKEDYYSLVAYTSINGIKTNRSELAMHGRALRKMATEKHLTIKKIPDERYGQVNSYPVEILDEYFEV